MNPVNSEATFESSIEAPLFATGWRTGSGKEYDAALGLMPAELAAFLAESQPEQWDKLCDRLGGVADRGCAAA